MSTGSTNRLFLEAMNKQSAPSSSDTIWSGLRDIVPLAIGVFIYGLAFGVLAVQAGMNGLEVGIMGATVFAGATQIIAVERLAAGAGALAAIVAGLALNLRLVLVAASVRDIYAGRPWWQLAIGAHYTTDENWALMLSKRAAGHPVGYWYLVGGGIGLMLAWISSGTIAAIFATSIPDPKALGMDFAFTAAFIAIAQSLWRGKSDLLPWIVAILVVLLTNATQQMDPSWGIILGGIAGAATAGLRNSQAEDKADV